MNSKRNAEANILKNAFLPVATPPFFVPTPSALKAAASFLGAFFAGAIVPQLHLDHADIYCTGFYESRPCCKPLLQLHAFS
jgi:hypothetical protein